MHQLTNILNRSCMATVATVYKWECVGQAFRMGEVGSVRQNESWAQISRRYKTTWQHCGTTLRDYTLRPHYVTTPWDLTTWLHPGTTLRDYTLGPHYVTTPWDHTTWLHPGTTPCNHTTWLYPGTTLRFHSEIKYSTDNQVCGKSSLVPR